MKKTIIILLALVLVFSANAFAAGKVDDSDLRSIGAPSLKVSGTTATCSAKVVSSGKTINATLELWQGGTLIASWSKTGTGLVTFSETVTIVRGLTYTLTLSGTINGVAFPTQSVTKTL